MELSYKEIRAQICDVCHQMWQLGWVAVSYTHLDVYKRQVWVSFTLRSSLTVFSVSLRLRHTLVHLRLLTRRHLQRLLTVSYTHLQSSFLSSHASVRVVTYSSTSCQHMELVRYPESAVRRAVSESPLRAPCAEMKYCNTSRPSRKFDLIGSSMVRCV